MDPPASGLDTLQSSDGGKVKKARKRPKTASCIPCIKRRQKCDRTQPCSTCVSRGIPCRWEPISDNPSPGRPHVELERTAVDEQEPSGVNEDEIPSALRTTNLDLNENREMLKRLSKRIQSLENKVVSTTGPASAPAAVGSRQSLISMEGIGGGSRYGSAIEGVLQSEPHGVGSSTATSGTPGAVGGFDHAISSAPILTGSVHETSPGTSITLPMQLAQVHIPVRPQASRRQSEIGFRVPSVPPGETYRQPVRFSLVHPGEFVGRENASYTLHSIRSSSPLRLPQARSTAHMSLSYATPSAQKLVPTAEIQHLIQYLPDARSGSLMMDAFFEEVNWRYGLPEKWLLITSSQMWTSLQNPSQYHQHQLNPYWLCLFFAVLACAPQPSEGRISNTRLPNTYDSETYYICSSTARRIAEDSYFGSSNTTFNSVASYSSPADGCVLECLAIPLLCNFLSERGRVSEAWKLIGNGVRIALSVGLHRDPGNSMWQEMSEEGRDLRRRAWWGLYIWDRLLSYVLGRPQMIRGDDCDVVKPSTVDSQGRRESFNLSRATMIQLADLMSEVLDKCMGVEYPTWTILSQMDGMFETWEMGIPAEFRPDSTQEQDIILFVGLSALELQKFTRHRYMITTWYYLARLKFYTLIIKRHQLKPSTISRLDSPWPIAGCVAEKCIRLALEMIKYQCDTFDRMRRSKPVEKSLDGHWYFEGCLTLFEAVVALLLTLTKFPMAFFVPPGSNVTEEIARGFKLEYDEMTRVISRVVDVFSEVVMKEKVFDGGGGEVKDGRRAEIASKALDALQVLLKEHWWTLDPRAQQRKSVPTSLDQSSPRSTGSGPATGMVAPGPGITYNGSTYGMGPTYPSQQQQVQMPLHPQAQKINAAQGYSGLLSPTSTDTNPSPSSMQQQFQYSDTQQSIYGNSNQYSMMNDANTSSSAQSPPFFSSYPQYPQNQASEATPPMGIQHSSPYDYQPQSYFSPMDASVSYPFPFTPISTPGQTSSPIQNQNLYQNQSQQHFQQPLKYQPRPVSASSQSSSLQSSPTSGAYTYNPSPSGSAAVPCSSGAAKGVPSSPGVPPPSQGMKMIHYVAPGSTTTSTITTSGMGVVGSMEMGTMSFSVSGMSRESSNRGQPPPQPHEVQQSQESQQSTIVLSGYTGRTTPTSSLSAGDQNGGGGTLGGYYH